MSFLEKLKSLTRWNKRRIDVFLFRIHRDRFLVTAFNVVLLLFNFFWRAKVVLLTRLEKLKGRSATDKQQVLAGFSVPEDMPPQVLDEELHVLLIVEESIPQCFVYRVKQKLEMLDLLGMKAAWVSWRSLADCKRLIHYYNIILFYRVPGFPDVLNVIEYAKSLNKIVIYDLDDLIFDRDRLAEKFRGATGQLSKTEKEAMLSGARLYRAALEACPFALASTPALADAMDKHVSVKVYQLPNGMDSGLLAVSGETPVPRETGSVQIFYGSGTKTHDKDFEMVAGVLAELLEKFSHLRLAVVGHLTLPEELERYAGRIAHLPLMEFEAYLHVLSGADISIAPLEAGIFADCKSEIKWLESAALGVPSVVSVTSAYQAVIRNGENAFLAGNEADWRSALETLVQNERLRNDIAKVAKREVRDLYGMQPLGQRFHGILKDAVERSLCSGIVVPRVPGKKRLLFVNTLYPPEAWGGATVVTKNVVDCLREEYGDRYEVCVFTSDIHNPMPYELREYAQDGVNVTAVSTPTVPDPDWVYRDEKIAGLFADFLEFRRPDLIHFHSIQHLTASMLHVAAGMDIPFVVTVHDAWWISDHQFLLDKKGELVQELQRNPVVASATSEDIARTIERSRYLAAGLAAATLVLAVSDYQADLYRRNGIKGISVNRNGVNPPLEVPPRPGGPRLQLGYLGGAATHKGYELLRSALEELELDGIELNMVDFDLAPGKRRHERWGGTAVNVLGGFPPDDMARFFALVDVLVAPSVWPESFGLITREASLMGRWVVASRAGGLAEDIVEDVSGHVLEMGDKQELKDVLQRLHDNPGRYRQPVDGANLSIRGVAEQVEELVGHYQAILQGAMAGRGTDSAMAATSQ